MREQKLSAVLEVAVHHLDDRLPEVGELLQELLLHLLELAVEDLPAVALLVEAVDEELLVGGEVGGYELIDEGDVVVVLADLEDLLAPQPQLLVPGAARAKVVALVVLLAETSLVPAVLDVPPQLDAELVRVDRAGPGSHGAGVVVGVIDDLGVLERLLGHDRRVPEGVVVDEALRGVAVRLLHRDVVDVGAAVLDGNDLVFPALFLEPAAPVDVVDESLPLAGQAEPDLAFEHGGGRAAHVDMPAAVLLQTPAREDPEIEQQELHRLAHLLARGAEDDPLLARVPIAVEVGAQKRRHHFFRGAEDARRDLLLARAGPVGEADGFHEEVGDRLGIDQGTTPPVVPIHDGGNSEQIVREAREVLDAFLVRAGQAEVPLDAADVPVANEVAEEGAEIRIHLVRNRDLSARSEE